MLHLRDGVDVDVESQRHLAIVKVTEFDAAVVAAIRQRVWIGGGGEFDWPGVAVEEVSAVAPVHAVLQVASPVGLFKRDSAV